MTNDFFIYLFTSSNTLKNEGYTINMVIKQGCWGVLNVVTGDV